MIQDALDYKFDLVLCKSIKRFGRNTMDILENIRKLKDLGIAIYFEIENINTLETTGEILITILAAFAQDESRTISDNVKWGNDKAFKKGRIYGNNNILGFRIIDNNLVIIESEAKIIQYIYDLYLEGYGAMVIAKKLIEKNIPTPTELFINERLKKETNPENILKYKLKLTKASKKGWNTTTILSILHNEKYAGHLLLQKYVTTDYLSHRRIKNKGEVQQYLFKNHHNYIIEPKKWEEVQNELERRNKLQKTESGRKTKHSNKYCWSGKIRCGSCGEPFRRLIWHKGKPYESVVWQCCGYGIKGKQFCDIGAVPEKILEEAVLKVLDKVYKDKDMILINLKRIIENISSNESYKDELKNTEMKIELLNEQKKELIQMRSKKLIDDNEFEENMFDIKKEVVLLTKTLEELNLKENRIVNIEKRYELLFQEIDRLSNNLEFDEYMVRNIIEKIVMNSKTNFDIYILGNVFNITKNNSNLFELNAFKSTMPSVLLNQFKYDLEHIFSKFNPYKKLYKEININIYLSL
jgi:DNA invertase Pin-like site-specific DNA recombinase